jgi:hypothetical protein
MREATQRIVEEPIQLAAERKEGVHARSGQG